jgi:hypothetical protein
MPPHSALEQVVARVRASEQEQELARALPPEPVLEQESEQESEQAQALEQASVLMPRRSMHRPLRSPCRLAPSRLLAPESR